MKDNTRHRTVPGRHRKSSATPNPDRDGGSSLSANGLLVRGVVVATYVQLDGDNPFPNNEFESVVGVYCDVLIYSSLEGMREALLRRCLVSQPSGGMHEGHVWKPRAARIDVANGEIEPTTVEPRDLDGDHVLVGFMDDIYTAPVILRAVPHPRWGLANEERAEAGHRGKLKLADGEPDFWKHRGTFHGVDDSGNFIVDTTRAHGGDYADDGTEAPADDAAHGDVVFRVNDQQKFKVEGFTSDRDPTDEPATRSFQMEWDGPADKFTIKLDPDADDQPDITVELDTATPSIKLETANAGTPTSQLVFDGAAQTLTLKLNDGSTLLLQDKDGDASLTLGDGAVPVAIADPYLKAQLENIISTFNSHTHTVPDGVTDVSGGSGAPAVGVKSPATASAPAAPMDPYDASIESAKLLIPDN